MRRPCLWSGRDVTPNFAASGGTGIVPTRISSDSTHQGCEISICLVRDVPLSLISPSRCRAQCFLIVDRGCLRDRHPVHRTLRPWGLRAAEGARRRTLGAESDATLRASNPCGPVHRVQGLHTFAPRFAVLPSIDDRQLHAIHHGVNLPGGSRSPSTLPRRSGARGQSPPWVFDSSCLLSGCGRRLPLRPILHAPSGFLSLVR